MPTLLLGHMAPGSCWSWLPSLTLLYQARPFKKTKNETQQPKRTCHCNLQPEIGSRPPSIHVHLNLSLCYVWVSVVAGRLSLHAAVVVQNFSPRSGTLPLRCSKKRWWSPLCPGVFARKPFRISIYSLMQKQTYRAVNTHVCRLSNAIIASNASLHTVGCKIKRVVL